MSSWKLVEAVEDSTQVSTPVVESTPAVAVEAAPQNTEAATEGNQKKKSQKKGGNGNRANGNRGSGNRGNQQNGQNGQRFSGYRPAPERSRYAYLAVQQIDSIFNPDNLAQDTYVRSYMDVAGFVPVSIVSQYQNVTPYNASYRDIINKLKEIAPKLKYSEYDAVNELLKPKDAHEMYLFPNPQNGGLGLPRYVKKGNSYVFEVNEEPKAASENEASALDESVTQQ